MKLTPLGRLVAAVVISKATVIARAEEPVDYKRLMRAIAQVETGTRDTTKPCKKVGKGGERSAWQMKKAVWSAYTKAPFSEASKDAALADLVASLHLRRIALELEGNRITPSAWAIALTWNAGLSRVLESKTLRVSHGDYAERVNNLYGEK